MDLPFPDWSLLATTAMTLGYIIWCKLKERSDLSREKAEIACCSNKNCIRCQRYLQVQKAAQSRYPWIAKEIRKDFPEQSLERVQNSIRNPRIIESDVQAPTVLMLQDLPSQAVVTKMHHDLCKRLDDGDDNNNDDGIQMILSKILREAQHAPDFMWSTNDSPEGTWKVLSFLNQGCWILDVCKQCPETFRFIESSIPHLLDECLFGNVMISKIYPGTFIEPHCGPTNVRHRLQIALQIPPQDCEMSLRVSDSNLSWKRKGGFFVFDDSFVHSVTFPKRSDSSATIEAERIVLIADMWHPDLSTAERCMLQNIYPPPSYA